MYQCQNWRTLPVPVSSTATGAGLAPTFRSVFSASGLKTCTPCTPKLQLSPAAGCSGCRVPGARARCRPGTEQTGHFSKQLWGQRHWRAWHWLGGVAHGVAGARCALLTAADDMGPDIGQGRAATHHYPPLHRLRTQKLPSPWPGLGPGCLVSTLHRLAAACTKPGTRGGFFAPCSSHNYT